MRKMPMKVVMQQFGDKHLHSGLKIIKISAYLAAGIFNEDYNSLLQIMNKLN